MEHNIKSEKQSKKERLRTSLRKLIQEAEDSRRVLDNSQFQANVDAFIAGLDEQLVATSAFDTERFTKIQVSREALLGFVDMFDSSIIEAQEASRMLAEDDLEPNQNLLV